MEDPKIQAELDIALAHQAWEGNEKGVMLASPTEEIAGARRDLLKTDDSTFVWLMKLLATNDWPGRGDPHLRVPEPAGR